MEITWLNKQSKESTRIFDSMWEVEEWVDSLYSDFVGLGFRNVGYATPDVKVARQLESVLPDWLQFFATANPSSPKLTIRTETSKSLAGRPLYKIWVEPITE